MRAVGALAREMGVVDALRFLSQIHAGFGDYTKDRGAWLDDLALGDITAAIKAKRPKRRRTNG